MVSKYFGTPFADTGDKIAVPDAEQAGGEVSYAVGYGLDYEKNPVTDTTARRIERQQYNQVLNDVTMAIKELQEMGVPTYRSDINYPANTSVVLGSDGNAYRALLANGPGSSIVDPVGDTGGTWAGLTSGSIDVFDTVSDLIAASLSIDSVAITKGYTSINDGGQGVYIIAPTAAVDGQGDHSIANGNIALLQRSSEVNAAQYGAFPSATASVNNAAIGACISANAITTLNIGSFPTSGTIVIPAGKKLIGSGVGENPNLSPTGATVIAYTGTGSAVSITGSGAGVFDLAILDVAQSASEGLFMNADGNQINGGNSRNIVIHNFLNGTSHRLFAANSGFIAYYSFENIRSRFAGTGIDIDTDSSGAFCSSNQWHGGVINGGTSSYGIRSRGSISNDNRFYGTSVEVSATTGGSISVEGNSSLFFDGRLEATQQQVVDSNVALVSCGENTSSCRIGGLGAAGLIRDLGRGNSITFNSSEAPQPVRSTDNLFSNSGFSSVSSSAVNGWSVTGAGVTFSSSQSTIVANVRTLTVTVPAGVVATILQNLDSSIYAGEAITMGSYLNASIPNAVSWFADDGTAVTSGQQHPGDNVPIWLGHIKNITASPSFIRSGVSINNSTGSPVSVEITMPVVVTGYQLPIPSPASLTESRAVMNGVISENFGMPATAASQMVLSRDGNKYVVSGGALITRINQSAADRFPDGTTIKIYAAAAGVTLSDNAFLLLSGNFTSVSQWDNITLTHIGAGVWVEDARTFV